jgi:NAD(P)-dependent dehydrogenase (short-subunit alcohol dehydrogenase family)
VNTKTGARELALVTGGETGIGLAISRALEGAGFEVRTASRRSGFDLTKRKEIDRLVGSLPRLDVLVHNAGIAEAAPLARTTDEFWERHLAVNLTAPFRLTRAALSLLQASPRPRVVFVASTAALAGSPYIAAYAASKHGVLGLARVLAKELRGVPVHAVCPGFVDSPLTDRSVGAIVAATGKSPEEARAALAAQNPGGRLLRPDVVALAVLDLVRVGGPGREVVLG